MFWFILFGIIAFVLFFMNYRDEIFVNNSIAEKIGYFLLMEVFAMMYALLIVTLCSGIIYVCLDKEDYNIVKVSDTEICALKDNQNINGSFFLGSGTVDEKLYYYYVTEDEFGMRAQKIDADETVHLKYSNENPHIVKYKHEFKNKVLNKFAFVVLSDIQTIFIPEGSVTTEFEVDLE